MEAEKKSGFHWGYAILIFFIVYVSYLVFIVIKSKTYDHSLVMDNYYQHDLAYQKHYDKIVNRNLLEDDLEISQDALGQKLVLNFGDSTSINKLRIDFYRASDASMDFSKSYAHIDESIQISTVDMIEGKWTIKVSWSDDINQYFKAEELIINKS